MPTAAANPSASSIVCGATSVAQPAVRPRIQAPATPTPTPITPPPEAQHDALDQELRQHVGAAGAHRHADADLARALGHRHQHDVHDADAAHQQRDAGDGRQQHRHHLGGGRRRLGQVGLVAHLEVVGLPGGQPVRLAHDRGDLLLGGRQVAGVGRAGQDLRDEHAAGQAGPDGRVGGQHDVVLVGALGVLALGRQHADDLEGDVAQADRLADGIGVREELLRDGGAEQADLLLLRWSAASK